MRRVLFCEFLFDIDIGGFNYKTGTIKNVSVVFENPSTTNKFQKTYSLAFENSILKTDKKENFEGATDLASLAYTYGTQHIKILMRMTSGWQYRNFSTITVMGWHHSLFIWLLTVKGYQDTMKKTDTI